jgi:hypothetical protein
MSGLRTELPDLPYGDIQFTEITDPKDPPFRVHIDHADGKILISADILDRIRREEAHWVRLDGDVLTFHGHNRVVKYLLGNDVPEQGAREATLQEDDLLEVQSGRS